MLNSLGTSGFDLERTLNGLNTTFFLNGERNGFYGERNAWRWRTNGLFRERSVLGQIGNERFWPRFQILQFGLFRHILHTET